LVNIITLAIIGGGLPPRASSMDYQLRAVRLAIEESKK